ncbi:unnamed protein product [Camellia sinensis]
MSEMEMMRHEKKKGKNENQIEKKWEDMQYDLLLKIFKGFNQMDLIFIISRVCQSWRLVCSDPTLWQTLDLRVLSDYFDVPSRPFAWIDSYSCVRLRIILRNAFALSNGSITNLIFHFYVCITSDQLIYVATSCPNLKRLVLPAWHQISAEGFKTALQQWKGLESMIVPRIIAPHPMAMSMMMSIGLFCDNFKELKIMSPFDNEFAISIAIFVPKLKVLSLRGSIVYKDALDYILNNMKHLEVLNITHCLIAKGNIVIGDGPVSVYWHLNDSILAKVSRLREFHACQRDTCSLCQREFFSDGMLTWHAYEESLLRMDEISSLAY